MSHVKTGAARIRKHVEDVAFRFCRIETGLAGIQYVKKLPLIPKALPFGFKPVERVGFAAFAHPESDYCHPSEYASPARTERSRCETFKITSTDSSTSLGMTVILSGMELLLATRNSHKTREFAQLLGRNFNVLDLKSKNGVPAIIESANTFEENAAIKAVAVSKIFPDEIVIADDSGLEVQALGGAPGVFSARYAGENANDRRNVEKLLRELQDAGDRSAQFYCVIAVAQRGEVMTTVAGKVAGAITKSPRGENGFGYDPIFVPNGFNETFAELTSETKNKISHRAKAAAALVQHLDIVRRSGEM
jgi:XTP/dITP diphosphohydrolase